MRNALRQPSRVHEDQRGPMLLHQFRNAVVDLVPHFVRRHRPKLARGNFDSEIEFASLCDLHDRRRGPSVSGEKLRDQFDWLLRGGKADARRPRGCERFEPFERQREMRAALVVRDGVNFVDDHRLHDCAAVRGFLRPSAKCKAIPAWSPGCAADASAWRAAHASACRPFARPCESPASEIHARRQAAKFRPAEFPGFSVCRCPALSAARRKALRFRPEDRPPALCAPDGRCTRERRRAFFRIPWAHKSTCLFARECAASPALAVPWACQICPRTIRERAGAPIQAQRTAGDSTRDAFTTRPGEAVPYMKWERLYCPEFFVQKQKRVKKSLAKSFSVPR